MNELIEDTIDGVVPAERKAIADKERPIAPGLARQLEDPLDPGDHGPEKESGLGLADRFECLHDRAAVERFEFMAQRQGWRKVGRVLPGMADLGIPLRQ